MCGQRGGGGHDELDSAIGGAVDPSSVREDAKETVVNIPPPPVVDEPRSRDRALRGEVVTLSHCLVRKPKNPYCEICTRTRTRQIRHQAGGFDRELLA